MAAWRRVPETVGLLVLLLALPAAGAPETPPAPPAPARPPTPPAPQAPPAPPARAGPGEAAVANLTTALLVVDARSGQVEALILALADALIEVAPAGKAAGRSRVVTLATALSGGLGGRLGPAGGRELSGALAAALWAGPARDLEEALGAVRAALGRAGLGAPDIAVVERELRQLGQKP